MSNPVQDYMLTVLGVGTTDATIQAYRTPPKAQFPGTDATYATDASYKVPWSVNGVPQTILPHPPYAYVWR